LDFVTAVEKGEGMWVDGSQERAMAMLESSKGSSEERNTAIQSSNGFW
jgi:hypothetical protein